MPFEALQLGSWFDAVENYVQAALLLVATVLLAKIADWIITRVVIRWTRSTSNDLDDRFVAMFHAPVFLGVLLFGLGLVTVRLDLPTRPEWITLAVLKTLGVAVFLGFAVRFSRLLLEVLSRHQDRFPMVQARTLPLFSNLASLILIGAGIYLFLEAWNIEPTAWLASAGIIGLALSFAAKDTLANLFAGVFILADAPYKVGDFVILDSKERGRVTHIGLRSTRLLTRDDIEITVPNAVMGNSKIVNESGGPHEKERIRIKISVAYGTDIDKVREILMEIAKSHPEICTHPEPRVRFREFGDSGLLFELLCWIDEPVLRGRLVDALNTDVYKRFIADKIEIPYPKQDLYVREFPRGPLP